MEITYLPDDDALVRAISQWHQAQWGHLSARSAEDRVGEFAEHGRAVPQTQVAFMEGRAVGTASLLVHDMDILPELTPWLASVYVLPERRRHGIGARLVRKIHAEARRLALPVLYLYTEDRAPFYEALGWQTMETRAYHGEQVTIMKLALEP